jgi:hypothetical protein
VGQDNQKHKVIREQQAAIKAWIATIGEQMTLFDPATINAAASQL